MKLTLIFTLSISLFVPYFSMNPELTSGNSTSISKKENMQKIPSIEPKSSTVSMDFIKTGSILDGSANDVMVVESLAYVADGEGGFKIIDISDPVNPIKVGHFDDGGDSLGVYVSESYAYIADGEDGLEIFDVSNPSNPTKVGQYTDDNAGNAMDVYVNGSYAYIADGVDGLEMIDISDPTNPVKVDYFSDGGYARGIFVVGNYTYIADSSDGLEILHVVEASDKVITIINPDSSSLWISNSSHNITWETIGYIPQIKIELYRNERFERFITFRTPNSDSYFWTIPSDLNRSKNYQIKITNSFDSSVYDYSVHFEISNGFMITGYNPFLLLSAIIGISVIVLLRKRRNG